MQEVELLVIYDLVKVVVIQFLVEPYPGQHPSQREQSQVHIPFLSTVSDDQEQADHTQYDDLYVCVIEF
jgi:hypothetical protein